MRTSIKNHNPGLILYEEKNTILHEFTPFHKVSYLVLSQRSMINIVLHGQRSVKGEYYGFFIGFSVGIGFYKGCRPILTLCGNVERCKGSVSDLQGMFVCHAIEDTMIDD